MVARFSRPRRGGFPNRSAAAISISGYGRTVSFKIPGDRTRQAENRARLRFGTREDFLPKHPVRRIPMSKSTITTIAVIAVAVLVLAGYTVQRSFAADNAPMPEVGQTAPTFTLPNQEGQPINLDQYRGKWVVLYFYPKDMTTGCTIEAHNFQRDLDKYKAINAVILGVSVDTVDSHKQFCTKDSLSFTLLADPDKKVVTQYGSLGNYGPMQIANRNTFLINPEGKIVKVWTKVNPTVHSEEVLAALNEMQKKG
jgi:peroxiredoxin Q/BCP